MKLFDANRSPYASRVRIASYAKNLPIEIVTPPRRRADSREITFPTSVEPVRPRDSSSSRLPSDSCSMDHLHLIYEDEIVKLFWDGAAQYHVAEWHGAVKGDKLRTSAYACVNASRTRPSKLWLADATDVGMLDAADQTWMVDDFYPRLCRNGVQHVAFVVPEKTLVHIPVKRMNKAYGDKGTIEFQYHPTREAATAWLATQLR